MDFFFFLIVSSFVWEIRLGRVSFRNQVLYIQIHTVLYKIILYSTFKYI